MEVKKKNCPNCGAEIEAPVSKSKVICEYCKKTLLVEKDKDELIKLMLQLSEEEGDFKVRNEFFKKPLSLDFFIKLAYLFEIGVMVVFVVFCLQAAIPKSQKNQITDFSQLEGEKLDAIQTMTINSLLNQEIYGVQEIDKISLEHYGMYLLIAKNPSKPNEVYNIFKYSRTIEGKEFVLYCGIIYKNVQTTAGISKNPNDINDISEEYPVTLPSGKKVTLYGFETPEDLYNKTIRYRTGAYKVIANDGAYVEK